MDKTTLQAVGEAAQISVLFDEVKKELVKDPINKEALKAIFEETYGRMSSELRVTILKIIQG